MKKESDMIQTLSFLAVQMEDSKHYALNAIQPGFISNETKFVTFGTNRFTRREEDVINDEALNKVIEELDRLAAYLHCTSIQAALFTAAFSKSLYRLSVDFDDIRSFFDLDNIDAQFLQHDFDMLNKQNHLLVISDSPYETGKRPLWFYGDLPSHISHGRRHYAVEWHSCPLFLQAKKRKEYAE